MNVRPCVGRPMAPLHSKYPLELFVKTRESHRNMTLAVESNIKTYSSLPVYIRKVLFCSLVLLNMAL